MKWKNAAILILGNDATIFGSAYEYVLRYQVGPYCVLTDQTFRPASMPGWMQSATPNAFAGRVTRRSKLIVVGHGTLDTVGQYTPIGLTLRLMVLGIREVGLVSFKCCHTGAGSFLDDFAATCDRMKLTFGWCIGYRHRAATLEDGHEVTTLRDDLLWNCSGGRRKNPDSERIRLVRGTLPIPADIASRLGPRFW